MKAVFYTQLFSYAELSIGAKMVYSQLIFRAVVCDNESFDTEGEFDIERARVFEQGWCGLDNVRPSQIAEDLNINPKTVSRTIKRLKGLELINEDNNIYVQPNILTNFIELKTKKWLAGWDLIVYSFLCNKTQRYKYVNTYRASLANYFGISETHLSNILLSLRSKGYIERKSNGKYWQLYCKKREDNL